MGSGRAAQCELPALSERTETRTSPTLRRSATWQVCRPPPTTKACFDEPTSSASVSGTRTVYSEPYARRYALSSVCRPLGTVPCATTAPSLGPGARETTA